MSMMSGMVGAADVMSIDSGPDSEFKFQDIDDNGAPGRSKVKRGQNMLGDVEDDVAQAYGIGSGKKVSIKRRSQSSQ